MPASLRERAEELQMRRERRRPKHCSNSKNNVLRNNRCTLCARIYSWSELRFERHCGQCVRSVCDECAPRYKRIEEMGYGDVPVQVCIMCVGVKVEIDADERQRDQDVMDDLKRYGEGCKEPTRNQHYE